VAHTQVDAVFPQNGRHGGADVFVFARQTAGRLFDHGDAGAEPAEHLAEFESNVAAAQHHQVFGYRSQFHDAGGVEVTDAIEPGNGRDVGSRPGIDEDGLGGELPLPAGVETDCNRVGSAQAALAHYQFERVPALETFPATGAPGLHDVAFPPAHHRLVHGDGADLYAVVRCPAGQVGDPGAGHHGLGGSAAHVDATAAHVFAFQHGHGPAGFGQLPRQGAAALAGADDDGVEGVGHFSTLG